METGKPRVFTWVIVGINVLFLVWIISALAHHDTCTSEVTYRDACRTGAAAGTTIAVGVILFICAVVDVILGVLWMVTRSGSSGGRGGRRCPFCAEPVQLAAVVCRHCGREIPNVEQQTLLFGRPITGTVCERGHHGAINARRCATCRTMKVRYIFEGDPVTADPE